jgi:uncharacterized membrane protein YGL010W
MRRTSGDWIAQYAKSHTHPVNRALHTLGIPMIAISLPLFGVAWFVRGFWPVPTALFVGGWIFQFAGHGFEGKPPEFFKDPRFLLVGLRWWVAKMRGRAWGCTVSFRSGVLAWGP